MANTTKRTATKAKPVATVQPKAVAEPPATTEEEFTELNQVKSLEPAPKKWANDEGVRCRSITSGPLYFMGQKSNILYTFSNEGDTTDVEYQDLVAAIRSNSVYITKPYFVIEDAEFVSKYPQVKKIYDSLYSIQDLREVFNLSPAAMKSTILSLPEGAKETIKTLASQMISSGQLDSIKKIAILDEIYNTKLLMMTELFNA